MAGLGWAASPNGRSGGLPRGVVWDGVAAATAIAAVAAAAASLAVNWAAMLKWDCKQGGKREERGSVGNAVVRCSRRTGDREARNRSVTSWVRRGRQLPTFMSVASTREITFWRRLDLTCRPHMHEEGASGRCDFASCLLTAAGKMTRTHLWLGALEPVELVFPQQAERRRSVVVLLQPVQLGPQLTSQPVHATTS